MTAAYERHIVLVAPEIHWNTGNIGRSCLGVGAFLHLIRPLGFSLRNSRLKRAGLDYWKQVKLTIWDDFASFEASMKPASSEVAVFSKTGRNCLWDIPKTVSRLFLIFGAETQGLPLHVKARFHSNQSFHIPILADIRSLNLSTAVGIALYESLRDAPDFHCWHRHP